MKNYEGKKTWIATRTSFYLALLKALFFKDGKKETQQEAIIRAQAALISMVHYDREKGYSLL